MVSNRAEEQQNNEEGWSTIGRSASVPGEEREDERIREDVCDRLMQLGPTDCVKSDVDVLDGVVTVRGTIFSDEAKQRVTVLIQQVAGVRSVTNDLRVE